MFGQMKSRKKYKAEPCSCGGSCDCHIPVDNKRLFWFIFPLVIPLAIPIVFPGSLFLLAYLTQPQGEPHILVNGKDCIVHHVTDYCTSTGACSSHDEAICPPEK